MPAATLTFSAPINVSCQVGDLVYYVNTSTVSGFTTSDSNSVIEIGEIREITNPTSSTPTIIADTSLGYDELHGLEDKFILFSKDNRANLSSPLGYYASVKMVNSDRTGGEMFSIATEIFESSK